MRPGRLEETKDDAAGRLLGVRHVDAFVGALREGGYSERSVRKERPVVVSFVRWSQRKRLTVSEIDESHVAAFLGRVSGRSMTKDRATVERAAVRRFLRYIRGDVGADASRPWIRDGHASEVERQYVDYLRNERGLAERSICVYTPFVRDLLTRHAHGSGSGSSRTKALDAVTVRDFLVERVRGRSHACVRLLTAALRSFLRFLYGRGATTTDLSRAVPAVCTWPQSNVHSYLSSEEVDRVLLATDRSTPDGRRDHAILLLLVRLGMRAGEVASLELDDVRWRTGEIVVRGKGRTVDRLPLLSDVGAALARYVHHDRGASATRRVFLRRLAPRVGFVGPAAIGHIVRKALLQAGVQRTGRGAAHLLRHSLATKMIRHGASISEIAEVLRHRSHSTTQIYAKVSFEALRGVARHWPGAGGGQ